MTAGAVGHPGADERLRDLLARVASGDLAPGDALAEARALAAHDLGFASIDLQRAARRGRPETIFGEGKTPAQVVAIARSLLDAGQDVLATRLSADARELFAREFATRSPEISELARTAMVRASREPRRGGLVGVVCAGTTDLPVAEEAAVTAEFFGSPVLRIVDVGVAGIHRLFRRLEDIERCRVLVVVAGMEGALPSVIAGLARAPVLAVPTSVGYGSSFKGLSALLTMLNSCAPGISVMNIDNGFGAGYLADVINEIGEPSS